ncbi:uncharacterized protein PAC_00146 [Phialocephala subalpina]|uniref:Clr5 domain-containing protein n=1 Tax=Phialocephala subalpina TaxID=576137 RepID=A0A1L7WBZ4_9HELO|nr:uncharacterized protein PAC_00146 [Phialocephala subalpina]
MMEQFTNSSSMLPPLITRNIRRPLSNEDWEAQRATFQRLYSTEDKTLQEVIEVMEKEYGFRATKKQYKTKIKRWGLEKNVKDKEMSTIVRKERKRREVDGKESEFLVRGRVVPQEKIRRYMKRTETSAHAALSQTSPAASTPSDIFYHTPTADPMSDVQFAVQYTASPTSPTYDPTLETPGTAATIVPISPAPPAWTTFAGPSPAPLLISPSHTVPPEIITPSKQPGSGGSEVVFGETRQDFTTTVQEEYNMCGFAPEMGDIMGFMFDSTFSTHNDSLDSGYKISEHVNTLSDPDLPKSYIRVYSSDEDILSAYYIYIHPYFPVLPPYELYQVTDNPNVSVGRGPDAMCTSRSAPDFEPSSPITLAISATLALIPHPDDPDPSEAESIHLRRKKAQAFALSAFTSVELESELVESVIKPGEALRSDSNPLNRNPFHPQNPLENESIIALLLLSTYEYAQRGNISKMRNRAGQALNAAMDLGLHAKGNEEGLYAEANKRVWWMTYITVCQGAILSNSAPPMLLYDPRFTTAGLTFAADMEAWTVFLQAQQAVTSATQFVIVLDATLKYESSSLDIWDRMLELDAIIEPLINAADTWTPSSTPPAALDQSELFVAQALRGISRINLNCARIKLHRYRAFFDVPVFTKKHCDLRSSAYYDAPMATQCGCSSTFHQSQAAVNISASALSIPSNHPMGCGIHPFSSDFSAKVCLKSAFNITRSFQSLPFPQPIRASNPMSFFSPMQNTKSPRTIPIFACCAMQSSYAMIILSYKIIAMGFVGDVKGENSPAVEMLAQLRDGLQMILAALKNYSIAYEALGGMRGNSQNHSEGEKRTKLTRYCPLDQIEIAVNSMNTLRVDGL